MKKERKIGFILILAAALVMGIYAYFHWIRDDAEKTVVATAASTDGNSEIIDSELPTSETSETSETIDQEDSSAETTWDGDSVALDADLNTSLFDDLGLDKEVLNAINDDTETLSEQLQLYLQSSYDITNITSLEWDGLCTFDYINQQVQITFDVHGSTDCGIQCIYNQTENRWSFNKLGEN